MAAGCLASRGLAGDMICIALWGGMAEEEEEEEDLGDSDGVVSRNDCRLARRIVSLWRRRSCCESHAHTSPSVSRSFDGGVVVSSNRTGVPVVFYSRPRSLEEFHCF